METETGLTTLPYEMMIEVTSLLDVVSEVYFYSTCKQFLVLLNDSSRWQARIHREFGQVILPCYSVSDSSKWKDLYINVLSRGIPGTSLVPHRRVISEFNEGDKTWHIKHVQRHISSRITLDIRTVQTTHGWNLKYASKAPFANCIIGYYEAEITGHGRYYQARAVGVGIGLRDYVPINRMVGLDTSSWAMHSNNMGKFGSSAYKGHLVVGTIIGCGLATKVIEELPGKRVELYAFWTIDGDLKHVELIDRSCTVDMIKSLRPTVSIRTVGDKLRLNFGLGKPFLFDVRKNYNEGTILKQSTPFACLFKGKEIVL